jgi:hypothetical protein
VAFDRAEQVVLSGTWLCGGDVPKPAEVVPLTYDYYFELPGDGGDFLGFPPFANMDAAQAWAGAQSWAPIVWGIG